MNFQKESLSNRIFKTLRDKIVFMEYPPGMNLSEKTGHLLERHVRHFIDLIKN